jgi:hypothetical protein
MRIFLMSNPLSNGEPAARRKSTRMKSLDVRPVIARGEEPIRAVTAMLSTLGADEGFILISPFLPSPLIEKLQADGFRATPERRTDGGWQTVFSRTE